MKICNSIILGLISLNAVGQNDYLDSIYHLAVRDAISPSLHEVVDSLISIDRNALSSKLQWEKIDGIDHVVMAHVIDTDKWHRGHCHRDSIFPTKGKEVWVTAAPEFRERFNALGVQSDTVMRVRQLYGFPPTKNCQYVIEFLVKPEDMFRPCADPEIDDGACELCSISDTAHLGWMNDNRLWSYYQNCLHKQYPWTQLGYTYDWHPSANEVGLSEFVIRKHRKIRVKAIYKLNDYLKGGCATCLCD